MTDDKLLRHYLLGDMPVEEQRKLEERFFKDAREFERLAAIEDELIDDYVCGDLSPRQRQQFEKHFLVSPERQERLAMAQALVTAVSKQQKTVAVAAKARPWWEPLLDFLKFGSPTIRYAIVAASLIVLAFYSGRETLENRDLRRQIHQLENRQEAIQQSTGKEITQAREQAQQLQKEFDIYRQQSVEREQQLTSLLEPQPYVLASSTTRSGSQPGKSLKDLQVARDSYWVKLQLEFDPSTTFKSYRAALQTDTEGTEIWSQSRLQAQTTPNANIVELMLPASIFTQTEEAAQRYKLTLWGIGAEGEPWIVEVYMFRIVIK